LRLLAGADGTLPGADNAGRRGTWSAWLRFTWGRHECESLRPDRKDEPARNGSLGQVRQWIESVFWTCKGQLTLEAHGGRTLTGVCTRVALRLLALAAGLTHKRLSGSSWNFDGGPCVVCD